MFATVLYHHRIRKPKAVKNDQEDYSDKYGELRPHESLPKHDIKSNATPAARNAIAATRYLLVKA